MFKDKDKAAAISHLQHAQSQKLCVVLHNYSSGNSGVVSDRLVEAYDVLPEDSLIVCYDIDKKDVRVFNINRIGYVEVREDRPWKFESEHVKKSVDIFHMTGNNPISISLQFDLMAKNLLIEEYPRAKTCFSSHKGNDNIWYLNTEVYALEGIGRFYMGLAEHIKIINAPELKEYVTNLMKNWLES